MSSVACVVLRKASRCINYNTILIRFENDVWTILDEFATHC